MNRRHQSRQELDFLSNMLQNNPVFSSSSISTDQMSVPETFYMRRSEIPQIARRLENCGSADNYLECFRSGRSGFGLNDNDNDDDDDKKEKFCQACQDICGDEKDEKEMVSGFVGSGVFLQLQAGSSAATRVPGMGNFNNGQSIFLKNPAAAAIEPISNKSSWQETWNNKCQNKMPKPYQFIGK